MCGDSLRISIFGQSHSPAIGCSVDGLPRVSPSTLTASRRSSTGAHPAARTPRPPVERRTRSNSSPASRRATRTARPSPPSSATATCEAPTTASSAASPARPCRLDRRHQVRRASGRSRRRPLLGPPHRTAVHRGRDRPAGPRGKGDQNRRAHRAARHRAHYRRGPQAHGARRSAA